MNTGNLCRNASRNGRERAGDQQFSAAKGGKENLAVNWEGNTDVMDCDGLLLLFTVDPLRYSALEAAAVAVVQLHQRYSIWDQPHS
jgi:hypothetical protein